MSAHLEAIPYEILSAIVLYSAEFDPYSLFSLIKTSRLLRHHAERHLYRVIDLSDTSIDFTIRFLKTIELYPRIGNLVASFHPDTFKFHGPSKQPKEYVDLFLSATRFMPNLKTLQITQDCHEVPKALQWNHSTQPPFRLDRLRVRFEWTPWAVKDSVSWDPQRFTRELVQLLQHQKALRHFSLVLPTDTEILGRVVPSLSPGESVEEWREACSSLEILEGTNTTVRLALPNTQKVKALFWQCETTGDIPEPFRSPSNLEMDAVLKESFFTPGHLKAYGRLENLVILQQISILPLLSTYLSSLKTLLLISPKSSLDREESMVGQAELFLQAIGGLTHLTTLVLMHSRDLNLDYERIFAACGNLQRLGIWRWKDRKLFPGSISMERGADGSIRPIEWTYGDESPSIAYLVTGWFATDSSEDSI